MFHEPVFGGQRRRGRIRRRRQPLGVDDQAVERTAHHAALRRVIAPLDRLLDQRMNGMVVLRRRVGHEVRQQPVGRRVQARAVHQVKAGQDHRTRAVKHLAQGHALQAAVVVGQNGRARERFGLLELEAGGDGIDLREARLGLIPARVI